MSDVLEILPQNPGKDEKNYYMYGCEQINMSIHYFQVCKEEQKGLVVILYIRYPGFLGFREQQMAVLMVFMMRP